MRSRRKRSVTNSGVALFIATVSLVFIVPMIGLAVDVGFLYAAKAHLQASVDGASLAAARALSLGQTTEAQANSAKQNAVNWFFANYPPGTWNSSNTSMDTTDSHVHVYDDATNPNLRHVDVVASSNVPTYFMRWFGKTYTSISATGFASRRDVNAVLVLDRSGSMCSPASAPCTSTNAACGGLITAAKAFTGQFAAGRDKIGAISFASNSYLHHTPSTDFQTTLGYTNSYGTSTGELDTIVCNGGTGSAGALALAYDELYHINQPGALNLVVFETDGRPNEVVVNQWDGTSAGLNNGSGCKDLNNKTKSNAGFGNSGVLPSWTAGRTLYYQSSIPSGIVGGVGGYDTGNSIGILWNPWLTTKIGGSDPYNENNTFVSATNAPGCAFASSHTSNSDLSWLPTNDVYGNNLIDNTYKSVTVSGGHISPVSMTQIRNASFNAVSDSAYRGRTNATLPVFYFAVGFNNVDHVILQRVANDPKWLGTASCTSSGDCVNYTTQPQGTYVYASDTSQLMQAFLSLSSQILRLSQ